MSNWNMDKIGKLKETLLSMMMYGVIDSETYGRLIKDIHSNSNSVVHSECFNNYHTWEVGVVLGTIKVSYEEYKVVLLDNFNSMVIHHAGVNDNCKFTSIPSFTKSDVVLDILTRSVVCTHCLPSTTTQERDRLQQLFNKLMVTLREKDYEQLTAGFGERIGQYRHEKLRSNHR